MPRTTRTIFQSFWRAVERQSRYVSSPWHVLDFELRHAEEVNDTAELRRVLTEARLLYERQGPTVLREIYGTSLPDCDFLPCCWLWASPKQPIRLKGTKEHVICDLLLAKQIFSMTGQPPANYEPLIKTFYLHLGIGYGFCLETSMLIGQAPRQHVLLADEFTELLVSDNNPFEF